MNIADAILKCQNHHKNNVLLYHVMYAGDFNDWKTFSEHYFDQILSGSKKMGLQKLALFCTFKKLKLYKEVETQTYYVWFKNPFHYKIIKCYDILS